MLIPAASVKAPPNLCRRQLGRSPKNTTRCQNAQKTTHPIICWYLTSLSKATVTPTALEESSQANRLFSRRRPSGCGFWSLIFDVCSVEYPVRDVVENLTIDCHYRIILIAVCAGERKAHIELVKEAKNLLQTQTWELCPKSLCWQGRSPRTRMGKSKRPNILEYTLSM